MSCGEAGGSACRSSVEHGGSWSFDCDSDGESEPVVNPDHDDGAGFRLLLFLHSVS